MERKSLLRLKSMQAHQALFKLAVLGPVSSLATAAGSDKPTPHRAYLFVWVDARCSLQGSLWEGSSSVSALPGLCKLNKPAPGPSHTFWAMLHLLTHGMDFRLSSTVREIQPVAHGEQIQPLWKNSPGRIVFSLWKTVIASDTLCFDAKM